MAGRLTGLPGRLLDRIVTRMLMLAALATIITMGFGLAGYYAAMYFRLAAVVEHMPPRARAEMEYLVRTHRQHSDRYYDLIDRYNSVSLRVSDLGLLGMIALVSIVVGGAVAVIVARRISRPITAVAHAAAAVSAGDRTVRVERGAASGEAGELIDSFNRMAHDIETYQRERTVLTAGIAHELRTPLTILTGRLHGLIDGVIDPVSGEADRLLRQVEHLSHLVEDLRTLAHADAGELSLDRRPLDLASVLRDVVADIRPLADPAQIVIEETHAPARVIGDRVRLTQVFTNILTNAVKHAPPRSRISVALFTAYDCAVASVIDEGEGFVPEDENSLFIPFWRADANKHVGRPGSGIGLTLAAKIVEAHGGRIVAKNRADRSGACFSIWIPMERTVRPNAPIIMGGQVGLRDAPPT